MRETASCILREDRAAGLLVAAVSDRLAARLGRDRVALLGRPAAEALGLTGDQVAALLASGLAVGAAYEIDLAPGLVPAAAMLRLQVVPLAAGPDRPRELLAMLADAPAAPPVLAFAPAQHGAPTVRIEDQHDLLICFSPDLTVLRCSRSYAALYDRMPADMIGRSMTEWLPPEELARIREALPRIGTLDVINTSKAMKTLPDGSRRWFRWIDLAQPARDGSGMEIVAVGVDVTESELATERLHDAIESVNEGFCLFDRQGRLVLVNEQFRRMYPLSLPVIRPGVTMIEMLSYSAACGELGDIADPQAFAAEVIAKVQATPDIRYQRQLADGRWILISQHRTSDGGYVGLRTDITHVKAKETALEKAGQELAAKNRALEDLAERLLDARIAADESNRAKSRFLAHMSHELRTPLNSILGFAEVMSAGLFGPLEPPRYREYVQLIHSSGNLLLSLINDVLDMSKIEAGKMELNIQPLPVASLAESCRLMMAGMARESSVALKIIAGDDCPALHADDRAVKQIVINLLSNAIKFTPPGGLVTLAFRNLGADGVEISVTDNGIGMTPEEVEKALQPFGQIDSELARQHKGTGIGLPLVKSLVELHGGRLRLISEKDSGTTALVTLPWHHDKVNAGGVI